MQVYQLRNKITGKIYIGQTSQELRGYFRRECWKALNGSTKKPFIYNAIRKYGVESFDVRTLVFVQTKEEMDYYEKELILRLHTQDRKFGYNLAAGGGGTLGIPA